MYRQIYIYIIYIIRENASAVVVTIIFIVLARLLSTIMVAAEPAVTSNFMAATRKLLHAKPLT